MTRQLELLPLATPLVATLVFLAGAGAGVAQAAEICLISPDPPPFSAVGSEDRLHPSSVPGATAHSGVHGQLIFGEDAVYWSHLPIFMGNPSRHPHNFQVIAKVAFSSPQDKARYRDDRLHNAANLYTVVPPPFDQGALVIDKPAGEPLESFPRTDLVRGHFEQGGNTIFTADFTLEGVVYHREFLLNGERLKRQSYLLFGRGEDVFLGHLLSAPPDFDQILAVAFEAPDTATAAVRSLVTDLVADGVFLELPDRANEEATRPRRGETLTCKFETRTLAQPVTIGVVLGRELYREAGEFDSRVTTKFNSPRRCADGRPDRSFNQRRTSQ